MISASSKPSRFRPTWVEVDLKAVRENARSIQAYAAQKEKSVIGVIKADAYGHGATPVARAIISGGVRMLAVSLVEEGVALRNDGIDVPIIVMGAITPGAVRAYASFDLTATIGDVSDIDMFEQSGTDPPVKAHLKIDTGMSRLGVFPEGAVTLAQRARRSSDLHVEGVYSHLATADDVDTDTARGQINAFHHVLDALDKVGCLPKYRHILNSAGLLGHESKGTNAVRVGLLLFGLYPAPHLTENIATKPILSWKSHVATVKRVPTGTRVGYGHAYEAAQDCTIVTVPVGYADGFRRGLSSKTDVLIQGKRYPVAGRICMDQFMVDVGDDDIRVGDEVILLGRQGKEEISAEEWADVLGTINYEIIPSISKRVPRVHLH